ncbi:C39 family peptidase [Candidatus Uhrbacteria bacterium]|nr:C39 family peptidase [Candidatus Uhrbacteria bacterium]
MNQAILGLIIAAMLTVVGLASYRFLDPRIKLPGDDGAVIKTEQTATSSKIGNTTSSKPAVVQKKPVATQEALPKQVELEVPFVPEAPGGDWSGPWKNACEEASLVMAEEFYRGNTTMSVQAAKTRMTELFRYQDKNWGSNANSDAARTAYIANQIMDFTAVVVTDPTLEDIKKEVAAGRPVITLNHGKELGNPNTPFLATGSFYHMLVVIGYDDETGEFITNDDGDEKEGAGKRYEYAHFMASIHDYVAKTRTTDGPVRVIFTSAKTEVIK